MPIIDDRPSLPVDAAIYENACEYARLYLTGNPDATTPTSATLGPFVNSAIASLMVEWPCLQDINNKDETDKSAFAEAVGRYATLGVLGTPLGARIIRQRGETKIGPVTVKPSSVSVKDIVEADCTREAPKVVRRIACVRDALAARGGPAVCVLASRRRAGERRCGY